jgi:hypothetical protein
MLLFYIVLVPLWYYIDIVITISILMLVDCYNDMFLIQLQCNIIMIISNTICLLYFAFILHYDGFVLSINTTPIDMMLHP